MDKNRYLIVSAIIVAVSLLVIDITIGIAGDYTMTIIPDFSGQLSKDNYRLNRVKTDVIIVGSSRGCHHYVSTMLKDSINQYTGKQYSLYNGAIRGKCINSNSCSVESIMDRIAASKVYRGKTYTDAAAYEYLTTRESERHMHEKNYEELVFILGMLKDKGEKETFRYIKKEYLKEKKGLR